MYVFGVQKSCLPLKGYCVLSIFFQLAIESGLTDAEQLCRHELVPVQLLNGPEDSLLLHIGHGSNLPFGASVSRFRRRATDGVWQIGGADHRAGIHGAASLDAVFQFTDVARPVV